MAKRFIRVPPNRVLVVYGKVDNHGNSIKIVKSGGTFVWPVLQDIAWLSTEPFTVGFPNGDKLTVRISRDEPLVDRAAEQLLGLSSEEINQLVRDHLLQAGVDANLEVNLAKIGLVRSDI